MSAAPPTKKLWPVRAGLAVSTLLYLAYSSFGIAAPFYWGHHGYHGATYMLRARMSLRLHMLTPATWTGYDQPPLNALYFHHPIGYHHLLTLLVPIFGEHEWLARGVAALGGLLALWALYALVRRAWSREAGLLAVAVYVCLPVLTSFSVLSDPMLPAFACVCWALNAYLQLLERPSRRALVHAALAYGLGGLIMWESYFIAPFIALYSLGYRCSPRGRSLRLGRMNALDAHTLTTGAVCAATMAFHIWLTVHAGAWQEFLSSYQLRHTPPSLAYVLERHTQWIEILFGQPLLLVGAAWLVVWIARVATGRARRRDLAVLTFLYVNTLYIYMFAEGSAVHLYRVFFFSGFFTLAVVDLVIDGASAAARIGTRRFGLAVGLVLALGYLGVEAPHAWANLLESRVMMGTHSQPGYNPEAEKLFFAREVTKQTKPSDRVIVLYRALGSRKEFWYYLDRSLDEIGALTEIGRLKPTESRSVLILDERQLSAPERAVFDALLKHHPVTFYERFTLVDLRSNQAGARSYAFVRGPMSLGYRWLVSHKYPPLSLARRAYFPGLCDAVAAGAPIARDEELPPAPPDPRLASCWYNYLVARGDGARAAEALKKATAGLAPVERYLGGARVIGAAVAPGRLRLAIFAAGPESGELRYRVRRGVLPQVFLPRSEAIPPPGEWRAGQLYLEDLTLTGAGAVEVAAELWKPDDVKPSAPPAPSRPPQPAPTGKPLPPGAGKIPAATTPPLAPTGKSPPPTGKSPAAVGAAALARPAAPPPPRAVQVLSTVELGSAASK